MRVIIVGAGVVGAATAYFAAKRGHDVTILDRHELPAQGASFANAGQLSYSYTDTLADPGVLRRLPGILLGRDIAMRVRIDTALIPWGIRFVAQCTRERADRNTVRLLQLAAQSSDALDALLADLPIDFAHRAAGKLMLTSSPKTVMSLQRRAGIKRTHGVHVEIIDAKRCLEIEPALERWRSPIAGAAYASTDDVGDAQAFTRELCNAMLARAMCRVVTDTEVKGLARHSGRIVGVATSRGVLEADAVVICAGVGTRKLIRGTGVCVPIYPLKGYSVTSPPGSHPLHVSVTDLDRRIVFANLGEQVRLAGLADCVGTDVSVDRTRVEDLVRLGREALPEAARFDEPMQAWAGLRPATPSGLPIVGPTRVRGLYLNVGHGALGWTLACGTAQQVAEGLVG